MQNPVKSPWSSDLILAVFHEEIERSLKPRFRSSSFLTFLSVTTSVHVIVEIEQMVYFGKYYIEFFWKGINKNINK